MSRVRCPICSRAFDPAGAEHLPFCSRRCRSVDLGRWLDERYGLPAEPDEDESEAEGFDSGSRDDE